VADGRRGTGNNQADTWATKQRNKDGNKDLPMKPNNETEKHKFIERVDGCSSM